MAKTKEEAKKHLKDYILSNGGNYPDWYTGIASEIEQRLFNDHSVDQKNGLWAWAKCQSADVAREVEDYLINTLGTKGGLGGGDDSSEYVYTYKITSATRE